MSTLGRRITLARGAAHLSREEMATAIGVTYSAICKYEEDRRRPNPDLLVAIAARCGVSTDYLLGRTNDPGPSEVREEVISFRTDGLTKADKEDLAGYFEWLREKRKREQQKEKDK